MKIHSHTENYTHYMSFENKFHESIISDVSAIFLVKNFINAPFTNPQDLIVNIRSRSFAATLSDDIIIRKYFFPNNFHGESNTWINPPLKVVTKIKNITKYILTGVKYEPKNLEEVEKFLEAFLNSKLKASYNSDNKIFELSMSGVSKEFSDHFFTVLLKALNSLYYKNMKMTLDQKISWKEREMGAYKGGEMEKFLAHKLKVLHFYELMLYGNTPTIFETVDLSSHKNEPLIGDLAMILIAIFKGLIFGTMLVLFKCKYQISFASGSSSTKAGMTDTLPLNATQHKTLR